MVQRVATMYFCDRLVDQTDALQHVLGGTVVACQLLGAAMRNGEILCVHHWLTDEGTIPPGWPTGRLNWVSSGPPQMLLRA